MSAGVGYVHYSDIRQCIENIQYPGGEHLTRVNLANAFVCFPSMDVCELLRLCKNPGIHMLALMSKALPAELLGSGITSSSCSISFPENVWHAIIYIYIYIFGSV